MGHSNMTSTPIFQFSSFDPLFACSWDNLVNIAVGSFIEKSHNKIKIFSLENKSELCQISELYPASKIKYMPKNKNFIATSSDILRIYDVSQINPNLLCEFEKNNDLDFSAPLTSFDWSPINPNLLATCSIDTTCTIWSLETQQPISSYSPESKIGATLINQIVAHDKEVCDIAFCQCGGSKDLFATVSADSSVRIFDLRHLEHSTILYEDSPQTFVKLSWNKNNSNYLTVLPADSKDLVLIDMRKPLNPMKICECEGIINDMTWSECDETKLIIGTNDGFCFIWDMNTSKITKLYKASQPIKYIESNGRDQIALTYANVLDIIQT